MIDNDKEERKKKAEYFAAKFIDVADQGVEAILIREISQAILKTMDDYTAVLKQNISDEIKNVMRNEIKHAMSSVIIDEEMKRVGREILSIETAKEENIRSVIKEVRLKEIKEEIRETIKQNLRGEIKNVAKSMYIFYLCIFYFAIPLFAVIGTLIYNLFFS